MKNKACVIIDNCMDCPYLCRSHYKDETDSWWCEAQGLTSIIVGVRYDAEDDVEIPDWCPILQPEGVLINTPKPFKLKYD